MSRQYIQRVTRPLLLYGKGELGNLAGEIFSKLFIPYNFIDQDTQELVVHSEEVLIAVCVATEEFRVLRHGISAKFGYDPEKIVPVWDIIEAYPEVGLHNGYSLRGKDVLANLRDQYLWVNERLNDKTSRTHYKAQYFWRRDRTESIHFKPTSKKEFIDVKYGSRLIDVVLRWNGDGIRRVFEWTIVHAEGMELPLTFNILSGIQRERRPLVVACYHSVDGFYRIPHLLMTSLHHYLFFYRQHAHQGQAAYLYCIPLEYEPWKSTN